MSWADPITPKKEIVQSHPLPPATLMPHFVLQVGWKRQWAQFRKKSLSKYIHEKVQNGKQV